jgi:4-amino-4-deoxy-L-arabinose transferase-like glycosyltransferase
MTPSTAESETIVSCPPPGLPPIKLAGGHPPPLRVGGIGRAPLWAVFAVALCIRLLNVALLDSPGGFFAESDTLTYWALGTALAHRESFWPTLSSLTDRMPLYPLLLAGIQTVFGNAPRAVAVAQAIVDAGTCALIAALGALIAPRVGLLAGILAAFCMTLVVLSSQVLTDTVFVFFLALGLFCTARFLLGPTSLLLAIVAGLAGGLALITRSSIALLLLGGLPLMFLGALRNTRHIGRASLAAGLFAIAAAGPAVPVLWRNLDRYHTLSLTSQTGDHLAFWIVPLVSQRADGTPYQETLRRMQSLYQARLAQRAVSEQPNPFVQSAVKTEIAREAIARLPLSAFVESWSEGMVVNLASPGLLADARVRALPKPNFYATPGASLWERAEAYFFNRPGLYQVLLGAGIFAMLPFLVLEAIGLVMLARSFPVAAALAAGLLAYFLLLSGPVAGPKYRLPLEPVLLILAALPLATLANRYVSARSRRRPLI